MTEPTRWVIDKNEVVHAGYCNNKGDYCIPYVATRFRAVDGKPIALNYRYCC